MKCQLMSWFKKLSILWSKLLSMMHCDYPQEILPQKGYITRMDLSYLKDLYPLIAVRRCMISSSAAFEESECGVKMLTSDAIGQVIGLSLNLLGGKFDDKKHILYKPSKTSPCREDWDGKTFHKVSSNDYSISDLGGFNLYYSVRDWYNFTFPYNTTASSSEQFYKMHDDQNSIAESEGIDLENKICDVFKSKKQTFKMIARTKINHHPTLMNYWHVQLDCYRGNSTTEIMDKDNPASERKKIGLLLKNELKVNYHTEAKMNYHIDKKYYQQ